MKTSQVHQGSANIYRSCHQPMHQEEPYCLSSFQILDNNLCFENRSKSNQLSFKSYSDEQYFTLESSSSDGFVSFDSPQPSHSYLSDPVHSFGNAYGSPFSGSSVVDEVEVGLISRDLGKKLLGPASETDDSSSCSTISNKKMEMISNSDLKQVLLGCAEAVSEEDFRTARRLMDALENVVSVTGEPIQRLGAYMLEGLKARLLSSGSIIYRKLKCKEPTSSELMSYMHLLYQICPYYKFAYTTSNFTILETMASENSIHIIDFQIAQGSQWISLIEILSKRPGGPPYIRITGIDDSDSANARGGGLDLVGRQLSNFAASCGVPFEFNGVAMSGCEIELENLKLQPGEALAVNFPYMLHHLPDESVSTRNHRDRLLRLVKSLSPRVVTLAELESNTNTAPFFPRFRETFDYYTAMFESIDAARPRNDNQRISAEKHCVARDIVNIIACEGAERMERHEPFGKWRSRFMMAGFSPCPLSFSASNAVKEVLKEYSKNYRLEYRDGVLYLGWKNRFLCTSSAWR